VTRISIKVIPKSGRSELKRVGNLLKVWLTSSPVDGKANDELVRTLAEFFNVRKGDVHIHSGFSSKNKIVDILGVSAEDIEKIP